LFDLSNDPNEHVDLASEKPDIVAKLRSRLETINITVYSPDRGAVQNHLKCQIGVQKYGGYFGPFLDL
jgi:hypothetical protein